MLRFVLILSAVLLFLFQHSGNAALGYIQSHSLFYWWGYQWFNPGSESEHGPLIVLLAGWLFVRNVRRMPTETQPGPPGVSWVCLGAGLALHVAGYAVQQGRVSIVGLLLVVAGVIGLIGGRRWMRAAMFPLGFMLFAIPVNFLNSIGFHLRLWVVDTAHPLAVLIGFDVIRNGTLLLSGDGAYQYDVAPACSGVRSLVALLALCCLVGYVRFRRLLPRVAFVLLCLPFTFVGNVVRIFSIIVAAEWFGQEAGRRVHESFGFLIFVVVFGLLLGTAWLWERLDPKVVDESPAGKHPVWNPVPWSRVHRVLAGTAAAVTLLLGFGLRHLDQWQPRIDTGVRLASNGVDPVDLPVMLGAQWVGRDVPIFPVEREVLPEGTGFSRRLYSSLEGRRSQVYVSIVLSGLDRSSIHRPEICLVGQGWTVVGSERRSLDLSFDTLPVTLLRLRREVPGSDASVPGLFAYWFVSADTVVASHWERMWHQAVDRLFRWRSHRWAYVVLQTDAVDSESAAWERLQHVAAEVVPEFQRRYAP